MEFRLEDYKRNVPDDELLADMRRVASTLGRSSITIAEQNEYGRFNAMTLRRRFKGWVEALQRAGLQEGKRMNIPEEELLKHIEELWVRLGRQPRLQDIKVDGNFGGSTYIRRFGSWRKALHAFISYINGNEPHVPSDTDEEQPSKTSNTRWGVRTINWRLRFVVMRRDNFKCRVCGRSPASDPLVTLEIDHIEAWSKGGQTILENLQTLCTKCNIGKSDLAFTVLSTTEAHDVEG